ncbi:MAG: hypothetical protein ACR2QA_10015 [Solirubrobacteraceae bacterium]
MSDTSRAEGPIDVMTRCHVAARLDVSRGPHEHIEDAAMRRCAAGYACFAGEMLQ